MRRAVSALTTLLNWLEDVAMVVFMAIATSVTMLQVVFRYLLGGTLYWAEELVLYSIICMSFVGASMGARKYDHISVKALHAFVPQDVRRWVESFSAILGIAFGLILLILGWKFFANTLGRGMLSPAMRFPMAWVYLIIPISGALIMIRYTEVLFQVWLYGPPEQGPKEDSIA